MKHILFVCATGIATSTAVTERVISYLEERGIKVTYSQINVAAVPNNSGGADIIVSTTNIPYELNIPVVNGLPIITGVSEEKVLENIYTLLIGGM